MASSPLAQYPSEGVRLYEKYVNPQWVRLLDVLQMNVRYSRCIGTELHTEDGRHILDFNSGYCVHNAGHNHPRIKAAIIFSPSTPTAGSAKEAFAKVKIPWMLMTGTKDLVPMISNANMTSRLGVYPALPPGGKYELVLDNLPLEKSALVRPEAKRCRIW